VESYKEFGFYNKLFVKIAYTNIYIYEIYTTLYEMIPYWNSNGYSKLQFAIEAVFCPGSHHDNFKC